MSKDKTPEMTESEKFAAEKAAFEAEKKALEKARKEFATQQAEFDQSMNADIDPKNPPKYLKCVRTGKFFTYTPRLGAMVGRFVPASLEQVNPKHKKAKK